MDPAVIAVFLSLIVLLFLGFHIGVAMSAAVLIGLYAGDLPYLLFTQRLYNTFDSFPLLAVPFFILAGEIMQRGSMSGSLISFSRTLVGHMRGSLAQISVLTCMFYGALCGSAPATTAAVGGMMIPAMEKEGYPKAFSTAVNACSGCLGLLIPPSTTLIIYGSTAGVSVSDLFLATIVPGIITGLALMMVCHVIATRHDYGQPFPKCNAAQRLRALWEAKWSLMVPVIVLGGIYGGITTPTEAGAAAVIFALFVECFITRTMSLQKFREICRSSLVTIGAIFFVVAAANALGTLLIYYNTQDIIAQFMQKTMINPCVMMVALIVLLLILGTFMETVACVLILTPMLLPSFVQMGIDPIHFGVVLTLGLTLGLITPPVGVNLFVGCGISGVSFSVLSRAVMPFLGACIVVLFLVGLVPALSLCLL